MNHFALALVLILPATLHAVDNTSAGPGIQRVAKTDRSGTAWSVRAPDGPLVFTGLVFAPDVSGDARGQTERSLQALSATLAKAGSDLSRVVRLNAYVADEQAVAAVEAGVAVRFADAPPAFILVRSPLERPGALVAFDAVATTQRKAAAVEIIDRSAAILPAGGKVFISGQAEKGRDIALAVKLTMAGLHRTLAHLQLKKADVVQVKAFIKPFADHVTAAREIAASFDGAPVPPIVLMEWVSELYTEIEMVAAAGGWEATPGENIAYRWLPWLTISPRYCRVTQVPAGTPLIFIGGIAGGDSADPRTQMKTIFERVGSVLFEAGSSYRNLAKATYYLVDPKAREFLGDVRGVYFDPARPPAASALEVTSLGRPGRAAMLDLIAVPVK